MCKVLCDSKTCKNYMQGVCGADSIKVVNHEYWNSDEKVFDDVEKCGSYEYFRDWMLRV